MYVILNKGFNKYKTHLTKVFNQRCFCDIITEEVYMKNPYLNKMEVVQNYNIRAAVATMRDSQVNEYVVKEWARKHHISPSIALSYARYRDRKRRTA